MSNCCGGGCGQIYKDDTQKMLDSLAIIRESGLLTSKEMNDLERAVLAFEPYGDE